MTIASLAAGLTAIIAGLFGAPMLGAGISQLDQWRPDAGTVRLASSTAYLRVPSLTSCNTIDTDGNGILTCGTDATGSGGGTGNVATSTSETQGQLAYWTSTSATPATLGKIATGTLSASSPLSLSGTTNIVGTSRTLTLDTSGTWTGNAGTASALAGNGTNCSAGSFPLGVDASGAVETCTDGWTEAENTAAAYAPQSRQLTVAGTANQVTSSAGAQTLAADRTWTLSLPSHVIFPSSFQTNRASTTNATSTNQDITGLLTFNGVTASTWAAFCTTITGGSGLCDGVDNTAAGAAADFTWTANYATLNAATSSIIWAQAGLNASSTSRFVDLLAANATTTSFNALGQVDIDGLTSALIVTGAGGILAEYAGTSCTNQFVRSLDALGAATCATVGTADVSGLDISDDTNLAATWPVILTGDTLSFGGLSTSSAPTQGQIPYWTGVSTFGSVATGTITNAGNLTFSSAIRSVIGGALTIAVDLASNFTWTGNHDFGGATGLKLPNGTAPTVDAVGEIALDTTSNLLVVATSTNASTPATFSSRLYPSFFYATTTWTGTTTIDLGPAYVAEEWVGVKCFTDAGTLNVSFSDGTNRMNLMNASTTVGSFKFNTNATFTAGEKRYVDIGTPASSPKRISCTTEKFVTRD